MVSGTLVVNTMLTKVLFDVGATHSINPKIAKRIAYHHDEIDMQLCVTYSRTVPVSV